MPRIVRTRSLHLTETTDETGYVHVDCQGRNYLNYDEVVEGLERAIERVKDLRHDEGGIVVPKVVSMTLAGLDSALKGN